MIQGPVPGIYLCPASPTLSTPRETGEAGPGRIYESSFGLQLPRSCSTCSSSTGQVVGVVKQSPPPRRRPRFERGAVRQQERDLEIRGDEREVVRHGGWGDGTRCLESDGSRRSPEINIDRDSYPVRPVIIVKSGSLINCPAVNHPMMTQKITPVWSRTRTSAEDAVE